MSLIPGGRVAGQYSLEDAAMTNSLALAIEQEFAAVYQGVKNSPLPATARQDMRLLFVGVARGVLRYLSSNEGGNIIAKSSPPAVNHQHQVDFKVDMG